MNDAELPLEVIWLRRIYASKTVPLPRSDEWKDDYIARVVAAFDPPLEEVPFLRSAADKTWDDEALAEVALEYDSDE